MSPSYSVDNATLLKILLHAAKYPYAAVNGLLLGTVRSEDPEAGKQLIVSVLDAIPLLHTFLTLTPSLETALVQVGDTYAKLLFPLLAGFELYAGNRSVPT